MVFAVANLSHVHLSLTSPSLDETGTSNLVVTVRRCIVDASGAAAVSAAWNYGGLRWWDASIYILSVLCTFTPAYYRGTIVVGLPEPVCKVK